MTTRTVRVELPLPPGDIQEPRIEALDGPAEGRSSGHARRARLDDGPAVRRRPHLPGRAAPPHAGLAIPLEPARADAMAMAEHAASTTLLDLHAMRPASLEAVRALPDHASLAVPLQRARADAAAVTRDASATAADPRMIILIAIIGIIADALAVRIDATRIRWAARRHAALAVPA